MVETKIVKTIKLNILPLTSKKEQMLSELEKRYLGATEHSFKTLRNWDTVDLPLTKFNLQKVDYKYIKEKLDLQSALVIDTIKDVFTCWKNKDRDGINNISIPFRIPHSGSFKKTKKGNPVVSIAGLNGRIGLPISQDGAFDRFNKFLEDGWEAKSFRLKRNSNGWQVLVSISKTFEVNKDYGAVIGIDMGSRTLATISILGKDNKILKQLYLGQDIWQISKRQNANSKS